MRPAESYRFFTMRALVHCGGLEVEIETLNKAVIRRPFPEFFGKRSFLPTYHRIRYPKDMLELHLEKRFSDERFTLKTNFRSKFRVDQLFLLKRQFHDSLNSLQTIPDFDSSIFHIKLRVRSSIAVFLFLPREEGFIDSSTLPKDWMPGAFADSFSLSFGWSKSSRVWIWAKVLELQLVDGISNKGLLLGIVLTLEASGC